MAAAVGLTIVKRMPYRGDATEEWSNQYWLTGAEPASSALWKTLADALIAQEKTLYMSAAVTVRAYGYNSDADAAVAVWSYDYLAAAATVPGTFAIGTNANPPGDVAAWVRWKTSRLNTRGKPIYLRKYYHAVPIVVSSFDTANTSPAAWVTAGNAFGTKMRDGTFLDARTLTARGHTDTLTASSSSPYLTTRTLKRRGKRPGA